jgi:uncharacterized membrane protein
LIKLTRVRRLYLMALFLGEKVRNMVAGKAYRIKLIGDRMVNEERTSIRRLQRAKNQRNN